MRPIRNQFASWARLAGLAAPALIAALVSPAGLLAQSERLVGELDLQWGDPSAEIPDTPAVRRTFLTEDSGARHELAVGELPLVGPGGLLTLVGQRVEVSLAPRSAARSVVADGKLVVASIRAVPGAATRAPRVGTGAVTGSKPWITIPCRFSDIAAEPEDLAFFQNMYANQPGGLDHYWRELSYGAIDIVGSTAIDWVTLPHPQTYYVPTPGSGTSSNLTALFDDCTAAADAAGVDFSNGGTGGYEGINMMFNDLLDCCAWGGNRYASLDGVWKSWRVTWEPPWGFANEGVIGHEMGHGFGLPHANNWDNDGYPYDNPWDVMSAATGSAVWNSTYGWLGKHTNAYHKDYLGWIPAGQRFVPPSDGSYTIIIDHMALAATANYRMAKIPIPSSSRFYVVEAREGVGSYEANVPGDAVLIYEVDTSRGEPAWLYDETVPPANYANNDGSMWTVGELFVDAAGDIEISIDAATANGFLITLRTGVAAEPDVSPGAVDFGGVDLGDTGSAVVTVSNTTTGSADLDVLSMILSDSGNFALDVAAGASPCGTTTPTLGPAASCTVGVDFTPGLEASYSAQLTVSTSGEPATKVVTLAGIGVNCTAGVDDLVLPTTIESGTVMVEACESITADDYDVVNPGNVTFMSRLIVLRDGFMVGNGADFTVETIP